MPAYQLQRVEPQEDYKLHYSQLEKEIDACTEVNSVYRNKLKQFLSMVGIWHISELDYSLRVEFQKYITGRISKNTQCQYITAFDRVKQHSIREKMSTLPGRRECQWKYENKALFIPYHSDESIAKEFDTVRHQENVVWDFSISCPENLKRQIFTVLNSIIDMGEQSRLRGYRLSSLKYLFHYCAGAGIGDLEYLEAAEIQKYENYIRENVSSPQRQKRMMAIVDFSRKILFLKAESIHWQANVWYLERLHFAKSRVNLSNPIERISFLEISQKENREIFQAYMKYELGVTEQAVSMVYGKYTTIRHLLMSLEQKAVNIVNCPPELIEHYMAKLQMSQIEATTFNSKVSSILHFYSFLIMRGYVAKIPFHPEYYMKKVIPTHHDRSVAYEVSMEILSKLRYFPEHLRLMYLHLWGVGLRISEVCTLKGNAYYRQAEDTWIQVYQVKMRTYKRIPIPETLYMLMQIYMKKNGIGPENYIFSNSNGGAFSVSTFNWQMKMFCKQNRIANGEYLFKSHDYRHTIATMFYENGVSIQSIRDYLGHEHEEMTEQYIDYIPLKIEKENERYFAEGNNSLAAGLKKGGHHGAKDIL